MTFAPAFPYGGRAIPPAQRARGVVAVLGPTNTGKTHLAIERMLGHESGVIGLPLRLLAREVYGRVVERVGADAVALVTGEEKIKPPSPRYWICTIEAMPRDLDVAFVAIDEVQLAADLDRGHVFTDRILRARGREETLLLGAATMRNAIEKLLPGVSIVTRPRMSQLAYSGDKKLTRLPRRSAIVAFSASEVYAIAELIRRQRGGAAVVMGALSPRTRNAQVALYQSGDVDHLVATDAIGMGLNLDVDHVAFAATRKFDGFQFRDLNPAELGQIAGRAGRHMRDGTFGVTGRVQPFDNELVRVIEGHEFAPVEVLQWRNSDLDMASLDALRASLAQTPREAGLTRAPIGEDVAVLEIAARDADIHSLAGDAAAVERLWDACQVPDYRKIAPAAHADLVFTLYKFLMRQGTIPTDWFESQIAFADRTDGDIDTLSNRIAHIRTWTFVANRPDWLADPVHWQNVARGIEDKLSDALHERLTQRFVDRRTSVLMRRLRENAMLEAEITPTGDVLVEGQFVGHLSGFRFAPDASAEAVHGKALRTAAQKALASEIERRAERLANAPEPPLVVAGDGFLRWEGHPVARLAASERLLEPQIRLLADEQLTGAMRDRVQERLERWLKSHLEIQLKPLFDLSTAADLEGIARGIAFRVVEGLGVLERPEAADEIKSLDQPARAKLRALGLRFGAHHVFVPILLKPGPRGLLVLLWALRNDVDTEAARDVAQIAASGRTSFTIDPNTRRDLYRVLGYRVFGSRAVRIDILERLADLIRPALAWRQGGGAPKPDAAVEGGFRVTGDMTSLLGCSGEEFSAILRALGYRMQMRSVPVADLAPRGQMSATVPFTAKVSEALDAVAAPEDRGANETVSEPALDAALGGEAAASAEASPAEPSAPPADEIRAAPPADTPAQADAAPVETHDTPAVAAGDTDAPGPAPDATAAEHDAAPAQPTAVEVTEIEVWRPGRPPNSRPQDRHQPRGRRRPDTAATTPAGSEATRQDAQRSEPARSDSHPQRRNPKRPPWHAKPGNGGEQRTAPPRERERPRERAPDPNSPFAALAKLKAELEARGKKDA